VKERSSVMNKWQPVIHNCDFILARKEISDVFELWQREAASEGGKYYMHPDLTNVGTWPFNSLAEPGIRLPQPAQSPARTIPPVL
jgi:hypothetical protein